MKKKLLLLLCFAAITTALAILLPSEAPSVSPNDSFRIGQLLYNTSDPEFLSFSVARKTVVETAGGQLLTAEMSDTPESIIRGVEDLIAMDCHGIILTPVSNSVLPQIQTLCEQAQVYWIVSMRPIHDQKLFNSLSSSPYFLGFVAEDDRGAAEAMIQMLADCGVTIAATYSISNLNATIEARELGIRQACADCGIEIVEEVVNIKQDDMLAESVEELLTLHPDLDAIISLSNSATGHGTPVLQTLLRAGSSIKFSSFDTSDHWDTYYDRGMIVAVANCNSVVDAVIATSLLVHAVQGDPISHGAQKITLPYAMTATAEQVHYLKELETTYFLAPDTLAPLLEGNASIDDFQQYQKQCASLFP